MALKTTPTLIDGNGTDDDVDDDGAVDQDVQIIRCRFLTSSGNQLEDGSYFASLSLSLSLSIYLSLSISLYLESK